MKIATKIIYRIKMLLTAFSCLISGFLSGQENLAFNGGFEEGTDTVWALLASGGSNVVYEISEDDPSEGFYCLKANVIETGSDPWSVQIKNGAWAVISGVAYKISIMAKADTPGSTINFTVGKATPDYSEYVFDRGIALASEWTKYTLSMTSPVTTEDDITLALHILDQDIYWFDDFSVVSSPALNAYVVTNGTMIYVTFAQEMSDPENEPQITFVVDINSEKTNKVTSVSYQGKNLDVFELHLQDTVRKGDAVTLNYYPGTIATKTGYEIEAFSVDVDNTSKITGISESLKNKIRVYPNPAYDRITIENKDFSDFISASIIDIMGTEIRKIDINESIIYLGDMRSGIYFLRLNNADGSVWNYRFVKY